MNDIDEVIRLANENYRGNNNINNRTGDVTITLDYRGVYVDIVDSNNAKYGGICLPPSNLCGIIICGEMSVVELDSTTEYTNADIIKMYPDEPVRVSYNKITAHSGPTTEFPFALSSFTFE